MKKYYFLLLFSAVFTFLVTKAQVNIPYQEIHYDAHYHWGPINVRIGHALVTVQADDSRNFFATLDGNSIPWEGHVFCVADTLRALMTSPPEVSHEKILYINGWYMKPKVAQYKSRSFDPDSPANYKNIHGQGSLSAGASTMEAIDVTANMLGLFYYFHELDFDKMAVGKSLTIPIEIPGGGNEKVVITYNGKTHYEIDGVSYPAYQTVFEYSYHGAMNGYPVNCIVSANDRIPLHFSAQIPIGHVELTYSSY